MLCQVAYSDGLASSKLKLKVHFQLKKKQEQQSYQSFFRLFKQISRDDGTAKTEEEEFMMIYNMRVIEIPTNKPVIRDPAQ